MSWTLFFQLLILIFVVGAILNGIAKIAYGDRPEEEEDEHDRQFNEDDL